MIKLPLKVKILKLVLRDFFTFSQWFFCYYHVRSEASSYLNKYTYKKNKNGIDIYVVHSSTCGSTHAFWVAHEMTSLTKNAILPCHWKHCHVLFLLVRRLSVVVGWFVASGSFFLLLLSLYSSENYKLAFFVVGI
jgi:hypothetical protein